MLKRSAPQHLLLKRGFSSKPERNSSFLGVGIAATVAASAGIYYYFKKPFPTTTSRDTTSAKGPTTTNHRLSLGEINQVFEKNEKRLEFPYHPLVKCVDVQQVASNDPCEDRYSHHALSDGSALVLGVYDGHGGWQCSDVLKDLLPRRIAELLSQAQQQGKLEYLSAGKERLSVLGQVLTEAFLSVDKELVWQPITKLNLAHLASLDGQERQVWRRRLWPGLAGSCALIALVDSLRGWLSLAVVGDCRAVLARKTEGKSWLAQRLTEDQTARNPLEADRMRREHPGEEEQVLRRNRVLGGLGSSIKQVFELTGVEPTRAFGDARYKWPKLVLQSIHDFLFPDERGVPPHYSSPPYVTAEPVITHHRLERPTDRFLIMATDGLWDRLTDQEAVDAMARYAESGGEKGNAATFLLKTAFGGPKQDEQEMGTLLAIKPPNSRRYRDDVTVLVVWFGETGRDWMSTASLSPSPSPTLEEQGIAAA